MTEPVDFEKLLTRTEAFIDTIYEFRDSFSLLPDKNHIATCINHSDLLEMRDEFVEELVATVVPFVYSKQKRAAILDKLVKEGRDEHGAYHFLLKRSREKFRSYSLQGQFSELLLSTLLQHYFRAAPLLRKMPITTNPALERNGADAIHIGMADGVYQLYIGEAKTYNRATGGLQDAMKDAVTDVISHFKGHRKELDLYVYEDFIPPDLEAIAENYKRGKLQNVEVHLVTIVTYDYKEDFIGLDRSSRLQSVIDSIQRDTATLKTSKAFSSIEPHLLPRLNYIIFPVREMNKLIDAFAKELGVKQ